MSDYKPDSKECPDCLEVKPTSAFNRNAARGDGLQFYCRDCYSVRAAKTYRQRQQRKGKTVRERVDAPDGYKHCPGCKEIKPRTEWHRRTSSPDGLVVYCKTCSKERHRRDHLKRAFGITQADLDVLIESQGGTCAICRDGKPEHIDHDHDTGQVRGVLCGPCNMGLGLFKDEPRRLKAAIDYLHRTEFVALGITSQEFDQPCCVIELDSRRFHAA